MGKRINVRITNEGQWITDEPDGDHYWSPSMPISAMAFHLIHIAGIKRERNKEIKFKIKVEE